MNAKEYLESKGYEFPDKDFWMEDYVTDHKFKDLVQLMEDYHEQKLNIASVMQAEGSEETRRKFCLWYYAQSQPLDANKVFEWFRAEGASVASSAVGKGVCDGKNHKHTIKVGTNKYCVICCQMLYED